LRSTDSLSKADVARWVWDIRSETVEITPALWVLAGHPVQAAPVRFDFLCLMVHPADLTAFRQAIENQICVSEVTSPPALLRYRLVTHWGEVRMVEACLETLQRGTDGRGLCLGATVTAATGVSADPSLSPGLDA
jgi:hypothetical protein